MKALRFLKLKWFEWLVIAAIFIATAIILLPALHHRGGAWLPKQPPSEDRRVFHPKGFSIVSPHGWKVTTSGYESDVAVLLLTPGDNLRISPGLAVSILTEPPQLTDFQNAVFPVGRAYSRIGISKGHNHARCIYTLAVNHSNHWYQVTYSETRAFDDDRSVKIPEMIMRYIDTFRP